MIKPYALLPPSTVWLVSPAAVLQQSKASVERVYFLAWLMAIVLSSLADRALGATTLGNALNISSYLLCFVQLNRKLLVQR